MSTRNAFRLIPALSGASLVGTMTYYKWRQHRRTMMADSSSLVSRWIRPAFASSSVDGDDGAASSDGVGLVILEPPAELNDETISIAGYVPCVRPSRVGGVRLDVEQVEVVERGNSLPSPSSSLPSSPTILRTVFHNYGHGGAGWSIGPGSVEYMLEKFDALNVDKGLPVAVIGAGVIGLWTTIGLVRRGYSDIRIYAESEEDLTSHKAAGLVAAFKVEGETLRDVAIRSMRYFRSAIDGNIEEVPQGAVSYITRYAGVDQVDDVGVYIQAGLMKPLTPVVIQGGSRGRRIKCFRSEDSIFFDAEPIMMSLRQWVDRFAVVQQQDEESYNHHHNNTRIKQHTMTKITKQMRRVESLTDGGDIPSSVRFVFNCTGAGAKELCHDEKVRRDGGHLVVLQQQQQHEGNNRKKLPPHYFLDLDSWEVLSPGSTWRVPEYTPKGGCGYLGGTMVHDMALHEPFEFEQFRRIINEAKLLFGAE